MFIKNWLEEQKYKFIHNKKCSFSTNQKCKVYYPDFLFDCNTFFIVLEVDEHAHSNYDKECEKIRENNISIQLGLPTVFIRYNPDKKDVTLDEKLKLLKTTLDYFISKPFSDPQVRYLFY
jgi:hypothetical protein